MSVAIVLGETASREFGPEQRKVKRSCLISEVSYESKKVLTVTLKASHMKNCLRNTN